MSDFEQRINDLDVRLFEKIDGQSLPADRRSLLAVQRAVRNALGAYTYLEIGSHLGGSLQTHYADPKCKRIYSIDKRPLSQPDERAIDYKYDGNSTERMLVNLRTAYPNVTENLVTMDDDARNIDPQRVEHAPDVCFIDGEHTNDAVYSDFRFCFAVASPNAMICFHDSNLIFAGLDKIKAHLQSESVEFGTMKLGGTVYVILLGTAGGKYEAALSEFAMDEAAFFAKSRRSLGLVRMLNRCRGLFTGLFRRGEEKSSSVR